MPFSNILFANIRSPVAIPGYVNGMGADEEAWGVYMPSPEALAKGFWGGSRKIVMRRERKETYFCVKQAYLLHLLD